MKPPPYRFLFFASLCFSISLAAYSQKPVTGKEPSWVTIRQYDYTSTTMEEDAEDGYLDVAYERQISVEERSVFYKKSKKILSEAGIQNGSEISINFDPAYQQLIFHTIRIMRGSTVINQLKLSKIKTIQQEKDLTKFQYDEMLTAVLFLEDVRKDDIIEFSYTLKGMNPVFKGRFSCMLDLNYGVPLTHIYYKLIVPKDRMFTIKNKDASIQPVIQTLPQGTAYEWKVDNVPALRVQDNLPGWYDPYSMVMVSEYKSWKEVNEWAMSLFPAAQNISPALLKKIAEIKAANPTPEKQVSAALRFVQDDIRYMGIEIGENSHRPGDPNKIFSQRFGDCKDKSYLLCTILHTIGIQASPVLINTRYKKTLMEWLPAANAFDHVTVRVLIKGKSYWFDPTISLQRGDINDISYPDYQYGLVVDETTSGLTEIPHREPGLVRVKEEFDIPDMSGNCRLTVITRYTGSFADDIRYSFSNTSKHEMKNGYRDFYAAYYKDITADSIRYDNEDNTGAFVTTESYSIRNLWEVKKGIKKAYFDAFVINGVIKKPKDIERNMPISLIYPAKYREEVIINLPEEWTIRESDEHIETDAFLLTAKYDNNFRRVTLLYEYEAFKDHVSPDQSEKYMAALKQKEENFSYYLSLSNDKERLGADPAGSGPGNVRMYVSLSVMLVIGVVVWLRQRNR